MDIRRRMLLKKKVSSGGGSTTGGSYTINLNGQWEATTAVPNPDSTLYDGVYRSVSNYNVHNGVATMYITIKDCSSFRMYIRSYAESSCDYVMVSQLDQTITGSTFYNNTTLVKAHTSSNQQSGTLLSNYTLVEFTGITSGEHTITVVYRKDGSVNRNDDRGYVLIEKTQAGSGDDEGGSSEGSINVDNYLTIEAREDGLTASLSTNTCEYCVDGDGNWKSLSAGTATESINSGQTLSFRGELTPITTGANQGIGKFTISKKCNLKGNCMSMLFGDNAVNNYSLSDKRSAFFQLFYNCTNIVNVSSGFLPATTLASNCYVYMFYRCTSLTSAPELPATTLESNCYKNMFEGCTSLTTAPALPATTLANYCYHEMFYRCTSLTSAPELPATTLASNCYEYMFYGCTNLTTAPELPATTLANYCYYEMFCGCNNLTSAPELPATTLANYCYHEMFYRCTSLTSAPALPATTLATYCYERMFYLCTELNYIKMLATDISASGCLSNWVNGVASTGTFVKNPAMNSLPTGKSGIPSGWTVVNDEEESVNTDNYLTIEALEDGLTASLSTNACEYCVDGDGNWKTLAADTATESINSGQTLSFRGNLTPNSSKGIGTFTISKKCNLKGNCMSMLFGDNAADNYSLSGKDYAFYGLFYNCTNIVNVSENFLPATTLTNYCYNNMFSGCSSLTTVPELPATTLATGCYRGMFYNCYRLTSAPDLPATTLASSCYYGMFEGCTSLTTAPELPATTLESSCYYGMFEGCTGLTSAPDLPATTLKINCYYSMFRGCTSLTTAHELPATTLANYCYYNMFYNCTGLTSAPDLPATTLANYCYYNMFRGCTGLTSAPALPATTLENYCYQYMFYGCTSLTTAPELPATSLASYCYSNMFYNCTSLTTAPELPATTLENYCYQYMFEGCTSLTTAPELPATSLANECYLGMFKGCTSLTTAPKLPATRLAIWCYSMMFQDCTSLTRAPELPVTTLKSYCYYYMFYGCTKLNYIKMLATDISENYCLYGWVSGVASTGTFVKNSTMTTLPTGTSSNNYVGIPSGWTVVNDGEENSIFPMYLNTTYDSSRGLYYRDEDDLSRSLWEWIEQNREKDPDGLCNEDYIPDSIMSQCELYIDDVKVEKLSTDGPGSDNYWYWWPINSKYDGAFDPKRILEGGRIEIWKN